ncbi:MAG: hypothetical protein QOF48_884 [Verrucomicrobiota bacterium]|jgi:tetratricopeptide (TPR) repeat protein
MKIHASILSLGLLIAAGCHRSEGPPHPSTASLDGPLVSLIETSRQAVLVAPNSAAAWGRLGQAFHAVEFFSEARVCYAKAMEFESNNPRWPHLLGLLQLQDQPEAAVANLERAARLTGTQPDASLVTLAKALGERGRFDEAARPLRLLLEADRGHPMASLELARAALAQNNLEQGASLLAPCATNMFTARPAILLLAQIRLRQGNAESAAALSQRGAAMPRQFDWPDPFLREVQGLRVDRQKLADQVNGLLLQHRLPVAATTLEKLLNLFPEDPEGLLLLGRLKLQEQKYPEAEAAFRRHLVAQPSSLNGLMQLGLSLLHQERWADGAAVLRQAIALKPDFAQAHYNLGHALSRAADSAGSIASYREALRSAPGDAPTHLALAEELARAGRDEEARRELDRAAQLDPNDPRVRELRARLGTR